MSIPYAFVTLLTSNAYLPGALTVAAALKDVHLSLPSDQSVKYESVCLVTPEMVDISAISHLRKAFDVVVGVETIAPPNAEPLSLLGRPDLDAALTKLHVFRLTQYSKVIFLDADVLPLRPLFHLFHIDHEFSAVPDVGWPDIFNSGVMVLSPGEDRFQELRGLLSTQGTWDGADQGLLNEWRGNNWNRLSFTYNTTPTANYTYAPAYKRFGPQIAVIHFIGPHKPWHSIAYRAQNSSARSTDMAMESSTEPPAIQQLAYDYDSLVDRWYSVYDRYYRSQAAEPVFQPSRYTSIWNKDGLRHAMVAGGALGLEELRRAALEGMEASGLVSAPRAYDEGKYLSMPLEGRFDLIPPRRRAERKEEQVPKDNAETPGSIPVLAESSATTPAPSTPPGRTLPLPLGSPVRWTTLPTPEVHEIPPAPYTRLISLPPTPLRYVPAPYKPQRKTREAGAQTGPIQTQQQESGGSDSFQVHLMSSPTIETPPNIVASAPTDTYFSKVRDFDRNWSSISPSSSETSLTTMEPSPSKPQPTPIAFFSSSLPPATPEMPRRQGKYHNIIGGENGSSTPDPTKVKRIFPWEERPRHTPGRVFPELSPALLTPLQHFPTTPRRKSIFHSPMPSPLADLPSTLQSHYLSDSLLSQRHAEKLPWPVPSSSPLGLENELGGSETSSQDGDVEDEVDSEEETTVRSRTRSSSIGMAMCTVRYRSIGVQTDPRVLREEGIQVTVSEPVAEAPDKSILVNKRLRRIWLSSAQTASPPTLAPTYVPTSSPLSQPTFDSHDALSPYNAHDRSAPTTLVSVEVDGRLSSASPFSPPVAPPSPAGAPSLSCIRKGSRVWDPARGVEAFKHGSEEVLAKFMKIGSWEERV